MRKNPDELKKLWENDRLYKFFRPYVDWTTRMSFRHIRTEGLENIPDDVPVLYAPNHCCTLMDAVVVLQAHRDGTAFGARADIFRKPLAYKVLHWLKIVPLARQRDGMSEVAKNFMIFDEIADCVDHGMPFCMFVEGTHTPKRGLRPIRKGIFRICDTIIENTGKEPVIVPVGIAYESFFDYMKNVDIRFGKPIRLSEHEGEDPSALLYGRMLDLLGNYPDHKDLPLAVAVPLAVLSIPVFVLSAILCWPLLVIAAILVGKLKDKAWSNTIRFASKLGVLPLYAILCAIPMFIFLPWWAAVISLVALVYSHSVFYLLLNFYRNIISRLK